MNMLGLYSGFGWLTVGKTLGLGARFGAYEILTAYCKGIQNFPFPVSLWY
jgi:hypothetical protein